jgi:hypothetical protein|nr:MAG TPA: hypothetical protein [Caudoviricetes sp.]
MNVRFANVNVSNWCDLSEQDQKIVGEFFDQWFNKTDGLGIATIHNSGNLQENDPFFYEFFVKSIELKLLVPDVVIELDTFYTKENGERICIVFTNFEDKGMTAHLNRKD